MRATATIRRSSGWSARRSGRDVLVVLAGETFADCQRRGMHRPPDRLIESLWADPRVRRVVVVNPFRSRLVRALRLVASGHGRPRGHVSEPPPHTIVVQPYRWRRQTLNHMRSAQSLARVLDRWTSGADLEQPVVITFDAFVAAWADIPWASSVVFYSRDDGASFPDRSAIAPIIRQAYRDLAAQPDLTVCAVSQTILDRIQPLGRPLVIPNGVAPREWAAREEPPTWLRSLARPIIMYTGTLDDRLDVDALRSVARGVRPGTLVLLGRLVDPGHLKPVLELANVHVRMEPDRRRLASAVAASDVCVIPHVDRPQTQSMSPLKLYEYLAAGRPVVATRLAGVEDVCPHRVILVDPGQSWGPALSHALELEPIEESDRLRWIFENAWSARHAALLDAVLSDSTQDVPSGLSPAHTDAPHGR